MPNILDYLTWRGDLPLRRAPFNPVDGAVLAQLAYAPFDLLPEALAADPDLTVGAACAALAKLPDLEAHTLHRRDPAMFRLLPDCPRFSGMAFIDHIDLLDVEKDIQFSAATFRLGEGLWYLAFRGTDDTLAGWKEDFHMAFTCPVPAQTLALEYLLRASDLLPGRLILGGHSKGGNLAVYAAAACPESVRDKIAGVYNYDGPGFNEEFLDTPGYDAITERVRTFVPQDSVFGMMLGHEEQYTIVRSDGLVGLTQHDIFSWQLQRDRFEELAQVTDTAKALDRTLKNWLRNLTIPQREQFVETVFDLLARTGVTGFREMNENKLASAKALAEGLLELDAPTRRAILDVLKALGKAAVTKGK